MNSYMRHRILMLKNIQYNHKNSRGMIYVVLMLTKVNTMKKDGQEDPAGHVKCLNFGPQTLNLIHIGNLIRSQGCVLILRVVR